MNARTTYSLFWSVYGKVVLDGLASQGLARPLLRTCASPDYAVRETARVLGVTPCVSRQSSEVRVPTTRGTTVRYPLPLAVEVDPS